MIHSLRARRGFSLIEIMIAVFIIGIMGAGALGVMSYLKRAKSTKTQTALRQIKSAIDMFYNDTGTYPSMLSELQERPADAKVAQRWMGPYVDAGTALEDAWFNEIQYLVAAKGSKPPYELYSWGAEGIGSPEESWIRI